jgi:hypothetical protein
MTLVDNCFDMFGKSAYIIFSANSCGTPVWGTTGVNDLTLTALNRNVGGVVTADTAVAHGFQADMLVMVSNSADASFNGTYRVTNVLDADTFTYTTGGGVGASAGGTVRADTAAYVDSGAPNVLIESGSSESSGGHGYPGRNFYHAILDPAKNSGSHATVFLNLTVNEPIYIEGTHKFVSVGTAARTQTAKNFATIARAANVVTATFGAAHLLAVNDAIRVAAVTCGGGGACGTSFAGDFLVVTVPNATTATWAQVGAAEAGDNATGNAVQNMGVINGTNNLWLTTLGDYFGNGQGWAAFGTAIVTGDMAAGGFRPPAVTFTPLPTLSGNGTMVYCSNCTIANPCAAGGTGAIAKLLNNVWVCN